MRNSLDILKEIRAASRPTIGIAATPQNTDLEDPWKSKFGGAAFAQDPPVFLDEEYDQYEVLLTMGYGYYS